MNVISAIFLATAAYGLYKRKWSALFFVLAAFLCSCERPQVNQVKMEPVMIDSIHGVYDQIYAE